MAQNKVRHQLFLERALSDRLETLAARPGATKSAILVDALTDWLNRRASSELDDKFGRRLDRLTLAIGRVERDTVILLETLTHFIRYELFIQPPLADDDAAGRAAGRLRFEAFLRQVSERVQGDRRTFPSHRARSQ